MDRTDGGNGIMSVFAGPTLTWSQQEIQEDAGFFASGGTVTEITQNGVVYRVHSFITVGVSTLTVNRQLNNLEYLVVAGGGGGGYNNAGGGGAGGLLYGVESVNPNIITITVGAGGNTGTSNSSSRGRSGSNSSLGQIAVAIGGGGGGGLGYGNIAGGSGGSGGGGGNTYFGGSPTGGSGVLGQGFAGGSGKSSGGGGATQTGNTNGSRRGGDGLLINSADIATIKMKTTGGAVKNWGFATTNLAASDFGIYQSNSNGGDPITAGSPKIYFNGSGNVGIGTSSPTKTLQIESGTTADDGLFLSHSSGTVYAKLSINNPGTSNDTLFGAVSNNSVRFITYNTERMRILSNGSVFIGTTS